MYMLDKEKIIGKEKVREELKKNNLYCNKTMDKLFDVGKKYKVLVDSWEYMIDRIGTILYAENYGIVNQDGKVKHTIRVLLEFDTQDMKEIIEARGTLGGAIALDTCLHCNQRITKALENCRWYYREALEEVI